MGGARVRGLHSFSDAACHAGPTQPPHSGLLFPPAAQVEDASVHEINNLGTQSVAVAGSLVMVKSLMPSLSTEACPAPTRLVELEQFELISRSGNHSSRGIDSRPAVERVWGKGGWKVGRGWRGPSSTRFVSDCYKLARKVTLVFRSAVAAKARHDEDRHGREPADR